MRGFFITIKNALTTAGPVGVVVCAKKKNDNRETPGSHDLGMARPP